jgi:hypothetical protein
MREMRSEESETEILVIAQTEFRIEEFRKRLRAMSDEQLIRYGKAARFMSDPKNEPDGGEVREVYKIQLRECRAEWRRRHPKTAAQ